MKIIEVNKLSKEYKYKVKVIDQAYSCFDKYLKSSLFVLVHNDLHFDNIFIMPEKLR